MKIASWNINGVKARIETAVTWLKAAAPDVVCLQEIKSVDEAFPAERFEELGYNVATHGQKGFNGVALLSKLPFDDVSPGLAGDPDDTQARYLEAVISVPSGVVRVVNIYLPNGNGSPEKFAYKLAWMRRLQARVMTLLTYEEPFVVAGDFLGLTEAFRACHDEPHQFTLWDYQAGAWQKNHGLRIDHFLLSPQAADRLQSCEVDPEPRGWEKPSDHVPIVVELSL
jgi:exodeoxyribonuclease-3